MRKKRKPLSPLPHKGEGLTSFKNCVPTSPLLGAGNDEAREIGILHKRLATRRTGELNPHSAVAHRARGIDGRTAWQFLLAIHVIQRHGSHAAADLLLVLRMDVVGIADVDDGGHADILQVE